MNFVNHAQLLADVRTWSRQLPTNLIAVAGVPRSGVLAAMHLALHRNIHFVTIENLERRENRWRQALRRGVPARDSGIVLVVDDSMHSGGTLRDVRSRLGNRHDVRYGAVYFTEPIPDVAEYVFRQLRQPRCFEWNLFHSNHIERACVDMDGVLCEDWLGVENDVEPEDSFYLRHVESAFPRWLPTFPVRAIVTSRLEKYRPQTMAWLQRHGIQFGELIMSSHFFRRISSPNGRSCSHQGEGFSRPK